MVLTETIAGTPRAIVSKTNTIPAEVMDSKQFADQTQDIVNQSDEQSD